MTHKHNYKEIVMDQNMIKEEFYGFLSDSDFPCVIAKNLADKKSINVMVAGDLACPAHDDAILEFMYDFVLQFRKKENAFRSAAVIFTNVSSFTETEFEIRFWERLTQLRKKDAIHFKYDNRVSDDPSSAEYSFSLMEEAFFVLGLHPASSRKARQFKYPVLIFNAHAQFEEMKQTGVYEKMKTIVRKRDIKYSGSINPMLTDFGNASEALQYSGMTYDKEQKCPLHSKNIK